METVRLVVEIPVKLRDKFKAVCKEQGPSMTWTLINFIETFTKKKAG